MNIYTVITIIDIIDIVIKNSNSNKKIKIFLKFKEKGKQVRLVRLVLVRPLVTEDFGSIYMLILLLN